MECRRGSVWIVKSRHNGTLGPHKATWRFAALRTTILDSALCRGVCGEWRRMAADSPTRHTRKFVVENCSAPRYKGQQSNSKAFLFFTIFFSFFFFLTLDKMSHQSARHGSCQAGGAVERCTSGTPSLGPSLCHSPAAVL